MELDPSNTFDEYLSQLGRFFKPTSFEKFRSLISLFFGEATGDDTKSLSIIEGSRNTFRSVVYPGEMAPDEWPKYKYLLLERSMEIFDMKSLMPHKDSGFSIMLNTKDLEL